MKQDAEKPLSFGKLLRREREQRGLTQGALADKVDATLVTISNWERGKTIPGPYHRRLLSELFSKSLNELGLLQDDVEDGVVKRIWNIPYARNLLFTGREGELDRLRDTLFASGTAALTQPQAISGLGGIGKTQAAVEYAYRYRDRYQAVLWTRADSRELLISDFVIIASLLNLPEKNDEDQTRIVNAVKRWLEDNQQWLLILDNADDLEMAAEFIPSAGRGHTLLTTRAQATGTVAGSVEIEKMEPEVGALFLLRRAKLLLADAHLANATSTDLMKAKDIVEAMDGLPLALDQAGAYIEETACGLAGYLALYKARRATLLKRRGRLTANHTESVATTWSLSFEKVEQANPAATELLRLCAFLHPDAIPEEIIIEGASELGPVLRPVATDPIELNDAINELRQFSLVKRDPDLKLLNIHRLVQAVLKDAMDENTRKQWAERTIKVVNRAFPDLEEFSISLWPKCQQYLSQVQACKELTEQWEIESVQAARLFDQAGVYLRNRAQYLEAENLLYNALTIREQTLGLIHSDVARSLNNLATLFWQQGRYTKAEPLYQRALAIREQDLGPNHPEVATSLNNLALLYWHQGKYEQAEPLYQRALAIQEQVLDPKDPDVGSSLNNLALLYWKQGKYEQAEPLYQRALAIREQGLGPNHPDVATSLNNLASLYRTQGKYEQAEPLYQRSLAIREQGLGPNHPDVAYSLNNLALLYHAQVRNEEAELLHQRALTIREQRLGPDHPLMATSLSNLGRLYYDQGKNEQAEPLFQRALTIREQILGLEHPDVAETLNDLATLYRDRANYGQAETLFRRSLIIREQKLGVEYSDTIRTMELYADVLRKMNREAEAEDLENQAKVIRNKHP